MKDTFYSGRPRTLESLKQAISEEIMSIPADMCKRVVENFGIRIRHVIEVNGGDFENINFNVRLSCSLFHLVDFILTYELHTKLYIIVHGPRKVIILLNLLVKLGSYIDLQGTLGSCFTRITMKFG